METWRIKCDDGDYYLQFGMHKNEAVSTTPNSYLAWIVDCINDEDLVEICQAELDRREENGISI